MEGKKRKTMDSDFLEYARIFAIEPIEKGTLLLIDNDLEINNATRSAFEFRHYKVFTAKTYAEG